MLPPLTGYGPVFEDHLNGLRGQGGIQNHGLVLVVGSLDVPTPHTGPGCRVQGMGYGVQGMGYGVWGIGYGVWGVRYRVWGMGYGA